MPVDITPKALSRNQDYIPYQNPQTLFVYPSKKDSENYLEKTEQVIESIHGIEKQAVFQIRGSNEQITCSFTGENSDIEIINSAVKNFYPNSVTEQCEPETLSGEFYVYDYLPNAPFYKCMTSYKDFIISPLNQIPQLLRNIKDNKGVYQVIIAPLGGEMHSMVEEAIDCEWSTLQGQQMSNKTVPSLQSGIAEERLTYKSPEFRNYYAVAFRLILPTNTLASRVKSFIANYTYGKMAFTIYDNNYYSQEQIIGMINQGKSYHYGFISNAHELTSILHVTHQIINDKDFNDIFVAVPAGDKPKKTTEYQDVNIGTWACGNSSKTIHLPFQRDIPHIYASGVSRSGKSTLLGHIAIERFKKGESVCVIDPHSDLVSNILRMVPGELKDDVVLIDFGIPNATPQITIRDNVDITNPSKVSDDLSEGMRDISTGKEKFFGPKMAYYFNALFFVYSVLPDLHLTHIRELLSRSNKAKTLRTKVSARINHPIVKDFLEEISHTPYESMIPVISRLSHLLLDEGSLRLFTLDENKISIKDIMDNGKLCLISLSVGKIGRQRGSILCSVIDCLIYNNALSRTQLKYQDRKPCTEIVDECQLFPLDFSTKIATVAKLNLSIIAANQFYEQLEPETREAMNSCGSRIAFKVNRNDSEKISRDFNNLNPEELTSLRQFEAFLKIDDEVVKIRTPKLLFNEEDHSQYIIQNCLDKYYIKHEDKKVISKKENLEFDEL